jgi:hypothetical protein
VLFHATWEFHASNSEEAIQRNLAFFSQWNRRPARVQGLLGIRRRLGRRRDRRDGQRRDVRQGATAPFTPWLRFSTTPILPIEEASAIAGEAAAARASFSG